MLLLTFIFPLLIILAAFVLVKKELGSNTMQKDKDDGIREGSYKERKCLENIIELYQHIITEQLKNIEVYGTYDTSWDHIHQLLNSSTGFSLYYKYPIGCYYCAKYNPDTNTVTDKLLFLEKSFEETYKKSEYMDIVLAHIVKADCNPVVLLAKKNFKITI